MLLFIYFPEDWPGVEVSRIHEGGNAAMVVSLFALGMARFRFQIPDQIIIFDPKLKVIKLTDRRVIDDSRKINNILVFAGSSRRI